MAGGTVALMRSMVSAMWVRYNSSRLNVTAGRPRQPPDLGSPGEPVHPRPPAIRAGRSAPVATAQREDDEHKFMFFE
jgi:hypothetical protein